MERGLKGNGAEFGTALRRGKGFPFRFARAAEERGEAWKFCVDSKGADFNFSLMRAVFFGFWGDFLRVKLLKRNF